MATSLFVPLNVAHAQDLKSADGNYTYTVLGDGTIEISRYVGTATTVSIPSTIDGKKVTSIGDYAFYGNSNNYSFSSITIPNTVTNIGYASFFDQYLGSITIPDSVVTIGEEAFSDNQLSDVTLGSNVKTIGKDAFSNNSISSVIIPDSVTSIGTNAFYSNSIGTLKIGSSVKNIGASAFNDNYLTSVTIPSNVVSLGNSVFYSNYIAKVIVKNPDLMYGVYEFGWNPTRNYNSNPKDVVFYASRGSTSEDYAKDNGHTFFTTQAEADATKAVEKAEASLLQSDVDIARPLVSIVEDATQKSLLNARLDVVVNKIAQKLALANATSAVVLAESTKNINDVVTAQNLINLLDASTDKISLQNRLNAVQDTINKQIAEQFATDAVVKAESSKTQADVDTARGLVNALSFGTVKSDLTNRLNVIQNAIDKQKAEQKATDAVVKAESSKTQADLDTAKGLVNALSSGTVKDDLTNRLNTLQTAINKQKAEKDATNAVVQAETTVTQADVDSAKILVNALPDGTVKTDLLARLDVVQNMLDKAKAEQAVTEATNAVVKAENSKTQADVNSARIIVNALPEGTAKTDLNNRLDKVQADIDKAKVEKAIQEATNAVAKAESSQIQADVDSAKTLVNALPDSTVKTDLNNRLDKVQADIDKAKAEQDAIQEATNAVEKAENSKVQSDVDSAKTVVNALPDGTVKDDLTNRLDKVQNDINTEQEKQKATEAEEKAKEAVAKAEDSQIQADVDSARTIVNALPDSIVKDDLNNRLDKVQEVIDNTNTSTTPETENNSGSADGETALAGTPINQNISILVKGGDLSLKNSNVTPFKEIELGDKTKTVSTDFTAPFTVKDSTGNQLGYRVDVSASQLTDGKNTLPKGTISLKPVSKIERVEIGMGEKPESTLPNNQILDDGTSTLISANEGEGMGVFDLTFPKDALSLHMNSTTTKIDGDSTVYTSTITWDLIQAP